VVAGGRLGIWASLAEISLESEEQGSWYSKVLNVLDQPLRRGEAQDEELYPRTAFADA
jgi:hypothetical protein